LSPSFEIGIPVLIEIESDVEFQPSASSKRLKIKERLEIVEEFQELGEDWRATWKRRSFIPCPETDSFVSGSLESRRRSRRQENPSPSSAVV
jgi:hypothetical protein